MKNRFLSFFLVIVYCIFYPLTYFTEGIKFQCLRVGGQYQYPLDFTGVLDPPPPLPFTPSLNPRVFAYNSRAEPTTFSIEKISFSLKLLSGHIYGQSCINPLERNNQIWIYMFNVAKIKRKLSV